MHADMMGASALPGGGFMIEQLPSGKLFFSSVQVLGPEVGIH